MTHIEILATITPVFRKVFGDPFLVLQPEHTALDFEHWDSINHVIIMSRIEKLMGIRLETAEMIQLKSVGDLIELISQKNADAN